MMVPMLLLLLPTAQEDDEDEEDAGGAGAHASFNSVNARRPCQRRPIHIKHESAWVREGPRGRGVGEEIATHIHINSMRARVQADYCTLSPISPTLSVNVTPPRPSKAKNAVASRAFATSARSRAGTGTFRMGARAVGVRERRGKREGG